MNGHRALALLFVSSCLSVLSCRPTSSTKPAPDVAHIPEPAQSASASPVPPLSPGARTEDERNTIAVFREAAASTVFVTQTRVVQDFWRGTEQEVPAGSGSGFVWDRAGHIVTNFHVVEGAQSVTVTFQNQQSFEARIVGTEPRKDIAVLKVDAPEALLHPVRVPKSLLLEVGQKTVAIGNPFGLDHTLTTGVVSALGRQVQGIGGVTIRDMIQTDAAINPGNSGGPLLDSQGFLIGMNTMIFSKSGSSAGIGFAVPAGTVGRVVPQIIKNGRADQMDLGIRVDTQRRIERRLGIEGVLVLGVMKGSPAERAGFQAATMTRRGIVLGDLLLDIDGNKVESYDDLYNLLDAHKPGDKVTVKFRRGDKAMSAEVEVVVLQERGP
jgi:S1-C subfamily serine protease